MYRQIFLTITFGFCFATSSTFCAAQEKSEWQPANASYGIFDSQDEYFQFMGSVKREGRNNPELMAMVPLLNDIVLQQPIGSTGQKHSATSSTLGLLANSDVRKELEIVDEQYDELQSLDAELRKRVAEQLRQLDFSDRKNATAQIMKIRDSAENELQSTLLPHQMEQLRRILLRRQLGRRSFVEIITSNPVRSQLKITDQQSSRLKQAEFEIRNELDEQIAKLQAQARKKLLSKLNRDQQNQVHEMFGDDFGFILAETGRESAKRKLNQ